MLFGMGTQNRETGEDMPKLRPIEKNDRRKQILVTNKALREACDALRHFVEHPNQSSDIIMGQGVYKHKDPTAISTIKVDGVEVGYMVKPCSALEMNPYFDRYVYFRVPGYLLSDLSEKEMEGVKMALYEAFFEPQQSPIEIKIIAGDALLLAQRFQVAFLFQRNKNLVSIIGGVDLKEGRVQ